MSPPQRSIENISEQNDPISSICNDLQPLPQLLISLSQSPQIPSINCFPLFFSFIYFVIIISVTSISFFFPSFFFFYSLPAIALIFHYHHQLSSSHQYDVIYYKEFSCWLSLFRFVYSSLILTVLFIIGHNAYTTMSTVTVVRFLTLKIWWGWVVFFQMTR